MIKKSKHIILKTDALNIGYRSKKKEHIVGTNINLELHSSELIGLVGANGIGKSTLIRTLTKVQPAINGAISINNNQLEKYSNNALAKVLSVVLTEPPASKNLTVFELIALGRQPYTNWVGTLNEEDINTVNYALEYLKIVELKQCRCYELSDGQLQKVMLARAIAQNTDLIILDEPTTHLDLYHKAYIFKILKQLTKETGKSVIFSTHEIELAIQLCDKLIVMGPTKTIFDTPKNHIENSIFDDIFPKDLISFERKTKSFKFNK